VGVLVAIIAVPLAVAILRVAEDIFIRAPFRLVVVHRIAVRFVAGDRSVLLEGERQRAKGK
jgi:hypothetical protein